MQMMIHSRIARWFDDRRYSQAIERWVNIALRQALDLIAAVIGLLLLAPLFLFVAIIIKLDSPGPVFYWSLRVGKNGEHFRMLKFRTMFAKPDSFKGPRITGQGDPRITPVGQWLRDTKLNELPQLWNVLKGEMSLVGPRPEDPAYVPQWPEETRQLLLSVRPGITSPASILYRDEEEMLLSGNVEEEYVRKILPEKLQIDSQYVLQRSILGDLDILFWTIVVMIPMLRRRQIPAEHLLWGPVAHFINRYFSWFIVDALVVFSVVTVTGLLWRSTGPLDVGVGIAFLLALLVTLVFSFANFVFGLSRIYWSRAKAGYILALFGSALIATVVLLLTNQRLPTPLPAVLLMIVGLVSWLGFVVVRYRLRLVSGAAQHWLNMRPATTSLIGERALIIGAGIVGRWAASLVGESDLLPTYRVVGWIDDNMRRRDAQIGGYRVLGTTSDIKDLVEKYAIGVIVFAIAECSEDDRRRILGRCYQTTARVIFLPDIVETIKGRFVKTANIKQCDQDQSELTKKDMLDQLDYLLTTDRIAEARKLIDAARLGKFSEEL